jgi:hypothetical protein
MADGGGDEEEKVGIIVSERGESMLMIGEDMFSHSRLSNSVGDGDDGDDEDMLTDELRAR